MSISMGRLIYKPSNNYKKFSVDSLMGKVDMNILNQKITDIRFDYSDYLT